MKSYLFVTLLFISSCFNSGDDSSRSLASLKQHSCKDYFLAIINKDINEKIDDDLQRYIERRSSDYWDWHENVTMSRRITASLKPLRTKLIRVFQNWNRNQIPIMYINDKDETLITLSKVEEMYDKNLKVADFKGSAEDTVSPAGTRVTGRKKKTPEEEAKEALDLSWQRLNKWVGEFESYPTKLGTLMREYMSLSYNISYLKRIHRNDTSYPRDIVLDVFKDFYDEAGNTIIRRDFKKVVETFRNKQALNAHILSLKDKQRNIVRGTLFVKGSRRELELEHAQNARRLRFVYDRVKSVYLTAQRDGTDIDPELLAMYLKIEKLLYNSPELAPSPNIVIKLEGNEINREFVDIFKTVKESTPLESFTKIYNLLTEAERARLELDEKGIFGRAMKIIAGNKWIQLGIATVGVPATGWTVYENIENWVNFFRSDSRRIDICIEKEEDNEFDECLKQFLIDKFAFEKNPLAFLTLDYEGLVKELKGNEEKVTELVAIVEFVRLQRASKIEEDQREAEFKREFDDSIEEIVKDRKGEDGVFIGPRNTIFNPIE